MKLVKASEGVSNSEDINIVDLQQIGATKFIVGGLERRAKT
jgi:hypothetical protein